MAMQMQSFTPEDVQAAIDLFDPSIRILFFETTTATSQQAADNIGCALGQIVKSLCFMVDVQPIAVLTSGDQRVDDRKLASLYNVGRKKVKAATPEECVRIWGYLPGGVAPKPYRTSNIPVYIDAALQRYQQVYAAGGAHNAIFPISLQQLIAWTGGQIMDVVKTAE